MKHIAILILFLVAPFIIYSQEFDYLRNISFDDYLKIDKSELKLRAYLLHFEPVKPFSGGSTDDLEGWDQEIYDEGSAIIPALKTLVTENEIVPNQYINIVGYELYSLTYFIEELYYLELLSNDDLYWFIDQYKKKMDTYIRQYKELNMRVFNFDYFISLLEGSENTSDNLLYDNNYKSKMRYLYIKYSDQGYKDLFIDQEELKFEDYVEIFRKYNTTVTDK